MAWQDAPEIAVPQGDTVSGGTPSSPFAAPSGDVATWQVAPEVAAPSSLESVPAGRSGPLMPGTDQLANWLTFGLANKAAALGAGVGASLPGSAHPAGFWDAYSDRLAKMRGQTETYAEEHPLANIAGSLVGGLVGAPVTATAAPAATMGSAIWQGLKGGATIGGLAGVGGSPSGRELSGGVEGALGGGAFGAALPMAGQVTRPLLEGFQQWEPMTRLFPNAPVTAALNGITRRVQQDVAAGGVGVPELASQLAATPGKPMGLVDVAGENVRGLAGSLARAPGPSRQTAQNFFATRDVDAGSRLIADIDSGLQTGGSAYNTIDQLMAQRSAQAAPLYARAMQAGSVDSPRLRQFLADPIVQQGINQGQEIQRLEGLASGQPYVPTAPPDMRALDAGKRGLDNMLDQYRDPTTGRMALDQRGRAIEQVRRSYLGELDNLNPDYAAARDAWAGPSSAMDAVSRGQSFQQMKPEEITKQIGNMSSTDRQFFLLGVADKLRSNVQSTAINGDEAKRLINNQTVQNQLRPLFGNQNDYDNFIQSVMAERRMFESRTPIMGGSQTAARLAEDAGQEGGPGMKLVAGALAAKGGEPFLGASMLLRGARDLYGRAIQPSEATRQAMAGMLFNPNYAANQALLQQLGPRSYNFMPSPAWLNLGARAAGTVVPPLVRGQPPLEQP